MRRLAVVAACTLVIAAALAAHAASTLPDASTGHAHAHGSHDHAHEAPTGLDARSDADCSPDATPAQPRLRDATAGRLPEPADAASLPVQLRSLRAVGDAGLVELAERGYLAGAGTVDDPYVIDGFRVRGVLEIKDTTRALVIRNSLVEGQLKLNYAGDLVHVHHNRINDLRVNENVNRKADTTAGLFEHNAIAFIGQMRHFSGEFAHNAVGPRPEGVIREFAGDAGVQQVPDGLVWNFDGYHLANVHDNRVDGFVDVKLHGHYHAGCAHAEPHNHALTTQEEAERHAHHGGVDHRARFHLLRFARNEIHVAPGSGPALRFNDRAHAGDDQTAASEPNKVLEETHEHHTRLHVEANRVTGGPVVFDIVTAKDRLHAGKAQETLIDLRDNVVKLPLARGSFARAAPPTGAFMFLNAANATLDAQGNAFEFTDTPSPVPTAYRWVTQPPAEAAGFLFHTARGDARIALTRGEGAQYGVILAKSGALDYKLESNAFNAQEDVKRG